MRTLLSNITPGDPATHVELGDHHVILNGVNLHYRVAGTGPLLFLIPAGWGVGSNYLQRGFAFLQERYRLIFLDTRGSGLSGRPADPSKMSSHDIADDLEALREYLGLAAIQIVGHSNSGAIALSYAERYSDRVAKMVLIDSQVLGLSAVAATQAILEARADDPRYSAAVNTAVKGFAGEIDLARDDESLTAFIEQILPLYLHRPEKHLELARMQLSGPIASYAFRAQNAADKTAGVEQAAFLDQICASVLIMAGRHDWICPLFIAKRLHAGIRKSRLVVFEESGHMPWLEEPEMFAAELTQFLEASHYPHDLDSTCDHRPK